MALTRQQWYEKLRSWVPTWFFEQEGNNEAYFQGIAEVLSAVDGVLDSHQLETFIAEAEGEYLNEHGVERGLRRVPGETDAVFSVRIRNITNTTNIPALEESIQAILNNGCVQIQDNEDIQPFYSREHFFSRAEIPTPYVKNFFTIWINRQEVPSLEFMFDRENFLDREAFYSANPLTELDYVYEAIVELVEKNKALGTMYQIVLTEADLCA